MLFILSVHPPRDRRGELDYRDVYRLREMSAIAWAITKTECDPLECLELANIPFWESGYERTAKGKKGEVGAWQLMPPQPCDPRATTCQAREALRRLRVQGIEGYCGCSRWHPCSDMVEHRIGAARDWYAEHPYP